MAAAENPARGPHLKIPIREGGPEPNSNFQVARGALVRIDFGGVEMATIRDNPSPLPMPKFQTPYYRKWYGPCECAVDICSIAGNSPKRIHATHFRIRQHIWRVRIDISYSSI